MRRKESIVINAVYCDICKSNITNSNRTVLSDAFGKDTDICHGYYSNYPGTAQRCQERFLLQRSLDSSDRGLG